MKHTLELAVCKGDVDCIKYLVTMQIGNINGELQAIGPMQKTLNVYTAKKAFLDNISRFQVQDREGGGHLLLIPNLSDYIVDVMHG